MTEDERLFAALLDEIIAIDRQTKRKVSRELRGLQTEVSDILDHYTRADGTINRNRVDALLRDLKEVEQQYNAILFDGTVAGIGLAVGAVTEYLLANVFVNGVQAILDAMEDIALSSWLNGMSLEDRSKVSSGDFGDRIRKSVRTGVLRGDSPADILQSVKDAQSKEQWKVNRIITSELNNAYRMQFATTANANGEEWVQFYESRLCTSSRHHTHNCHLLANEDRYGKDLGVFRWDDEEIYAPHPQCRGFIGLYREG